MRRSATSVCRGLRARLRDGAWTPGGVPLNTLLMGARTLLRGLVALAMLPLLVDRIGATPAGLFIFATTLTGYFTAVEWGLATSVTKYVAAHRATGDARQLGSLLRASLALLLGLGVLIAVLLVLLALLLGRSLFDAPSVRSQAAPTLLVAAGTALLYWPSRIGTAALQGLERYDLCALLETASALLAFASIYVVSGLTHSVAVLTALFGAAAILMGVGAGALAWPRLGLRRGLGSWRGAHLRSLLGFGGGLFLIGLSDTFIYESDRIVVTAFVGVAAIVVYEVALRIYTSVRLISGLIGAALVSTSSRLAAENRAERLRELVLVGSLYTVMLTVPLAVLILVLARPLVDAWVGHGYGRHAVYVQIFVSCWLVGANGGVLASAMTGIGRIRAFVVLTVLGALITLGLSIGLTAAWGTVGVIWGTVISSWVGFPIWMHYALRQVEISKARYAREVLAPGYLPVMAWTVPVVACARLLHPTGLPGLGAFCAIALAVLVLALAPMLRARWRRMLVEPPLRGANAVPAGIGASP